MGTPLNSQRAAFPAECIPKSNLLSFRRLLIQTEPCERQGEGQGEGQGENETALSPARAGPERNCDRAKGVIIA